MWRGLVNRVSAKKKGDGIAAVALGSIVLVSYSAAIFGIAASIAAESRGGDIGRSVMRTPVARAMALPMAPVGGTIGTSPTPRTP